MSDLDALYRAVLDRPDDDTPRLVYADALDDLGEADLAAFVRNQVEAARAAPWEPAAIRVRCFRGEIPLGSVWLSQLPELPDGLSWEARPFRRGFPALVQARDGAAFVAAADRLFDLAPVESLELATTPAGDVAALAACPGLSQLRRLVIKAGLGRATARVLLNSDHLGSLEELVIGAGLTSAQTAREVVGSRVFRRLRAFSYRDEERGGALVTALAGLADPPPLRSLDLQGNRLTADGLWRLVESPIASGLESLEVGDNHLGPAGFRELLRPGVLPALRRLDLMRAALGISGLADGDAAELAGRLRFLNLGGNALGPNGGRLLRAIPFAGLRVLDLRDNALGDTGTEQLVAAEWVAQLLHLDLSENHIGPLGADALATAPGLDGLVALELGGNPLNRTAKERLRERFGERVLF